MRKDFLYCSYDDSFISSLWAIVVFLKNYSVTSVFIILLQNLRLRRILCRMQFFPNALAKQIIIAHGKGRLKSFSELTCYKHHCKLRCIEILPTFVVPLFRLRRVGHPKDSYKSAYCKFLSISTHLLQRIST